MDDFWWKFNPILLVLVLPPGDQIAGMLAVAVASSRTLEVLDLEGTNLTNQSAQVLEFFQHQSHVICLFWVSTFQHS